MPTSWPTTEVETLEQLMETLLGLHGRRWVFRGQARTHGTLIPSIDRKPLDQLSRAKKLALERQALDTFRATARVFASDGEKHSLTDPIVALMVLRHHEVPTRLLDWSGSPYVACYFAANAHQDENAEIWAFDEPRYELEGAKQWQACPETTLDGSGNPALFAAALTAFRLEEPCDWFICAFYSEGFPRQLAQNGLYSMTARFGQDHAVHIARLLDEDHRHRFVIPARLKPELLVQLRERHGLWRGSLYPDSAGAAETAGLIFKPARPTLPPAAPN